MKENLLDKSFILGPRYSLVGKNPLKWNIALTFEKAYCSILFDMQCCIYPL